MWALQRGAGLVPRGALLVGVGDLQQARVALEMALRINPAYSKAQRNLGDVYVQLALQAYQQAKQPELANRIEALQQLTPKR